MHSILMEMKQMNKRIMDLEKKHEKNETSTKVRNNLGTTSAFVALKDIWLPPIWEQLNRIESEIDSMNA